MSQRLAAGRPRVDWRMREGASAGRNWSVCRKQEVEVEVKFESPRSLMREGERLVGRGGKWKVESRELLMPSSGRRDRSGGGR